MKVLQIIPTLGMGGAEVMCETLTNALISKGHEVIVISLYEEKTIIADRLNQAGVNIRYLGKKKGLDFSCVKNLKQIIKEYQPDVVHTHLYALKYAVMAMIGLSMTPIVHTVHSVAQKESGKVDKALNKLIFLSKKAIPVALSSEVQKSMQSVYGIMEEDCPIVANGVTLEKYLPKKEYGLLDPVSLIHVGSFSPVKNHMCMIEAVQRLRDEGVSVRLRLVGDGMLRDEIERKIVECKLNEYVELCGVSSEIHKKLIESDIFVFPSKWEGIPMSLIEAMGTGLPIVASNVGGIKDMLKNEETALLINPASEELALAIVRLINDYGLRKTIGINAYKQSRKYSATTMASAYEKIYNTVR